MCVFAALTEGKALVNLNVPHSTQQLETQTYWWKDCGCGKGIETVCIEFKCSYR